MLVQIFAYKLSRINNIPNNPLQQQHIKHTFCSDNKNNNLPKDKSNKVLLENYK